MTTDISAAKLGKLYLKVFKQIPTFLRQFGFSCFIRKLLLSVELNHQNLKLKTVSNLY